MPSYIHLEMRAHADVILITVDPRSFAIVAPPKPEMKLQSIILQTALVWDDYGRIDYLVSIKPRSYGSLKKKKKICDLKISDYIEFIIPSFQLDRPNALKFLPFFTRTRAEPTSCTLPRATVL